MATYQSFEEMPIWKEARELAFEIYKLTFDSPFSSDFALRDQIRRSAGSVMDNIAEGYERDSRLEFINFLSISKGSLGEVRSQLHRAYDLKYFSDEVYELMLLKGKGLSSQIANFIKYLNSTTIKGTKFKNRVN